MKLRDYKVLLFVVFIWISVAGQHKLTGTVTDQNNKPIYNAEVYNQNTGEQTTTKQDGSFEFTDIENGEYLITIFNYDFDILEKQVTVDGDTQINLVLNPLGEELSEVLITQRRERIFGLKQLKPVEGTAIYAGKKSEVVLLENTIGNLASNNARQIYAQVVGLNIYENSIGGLQLNIGGRGLDPNRTANFNTRQNGYDISADVLGYPESYYTPPAEALSEIQVVRGAASLQYGTQFGGLINFKMKQPNPNKKIELVSRQSLGSFNLFTSFNSLSGTVGKFSYYTYFNYKQGDGFRPNSEFDSKNFYAHLGYQLSEKTKLIGEFTYLNYLAKQPGGLTDTQFELDPDFSNRTRNWFEVDWKLYSLKLEHQFSEKTDFSLNFFGLDASRSALGFRGIPTDLNTNPITADDEVDANGNFVNPRDLIVGNFKNWGAEARLLSRYNILGKESVFLIGSKYYQANNDARQGPGSLGTDADFSFQNDRFPDYANQSTFDFPNLNIAVFGENIFNISDKFSITPGFRFEYIKTETEGIYNNVVFDNAGNPINNTTETDDDTLERSFVLLGIGSSYKISPEIEAYANVSQNYRSVTFSDIRIVNPTFSIRPDIGDEEGFTADIGIRGKINDDLTYDASLFGLWYDDRIGEVFNDRAQRVRGNIGDALIYGIESYTNWNIGNTFFVNNTNYVLNTFVNLAITDSEYTRSEEPIEGNKVEFIPLINLKTGIGFGYKNFLGNIQFTHLSEQFTEVTNADRGLTGTKEEGTLGKIPAYSIVDISFSYTYRKFKLETGINNLLDESYFTQRATGYPGPGIIPAAPISWYATLQFTL
ncbi:TonB-dependent receptor domain-containing protein [Aquimarina celericrescens]|uniref:TonB-dependent receptor domain-containing protein n=1 Tax=Aquimarina celericrescens TaxID=1964542 RepID=A0ABW5AYE6_9FLAO|nr:carboxypeptidase-like regulatory domain-containing protein [Aquimarina celericrescens]